MKLIIVTCLKRLAAVWGVMLLLFGGWFVLMPSARADAPNCDNNAVIRCGVTSPDDLKQKYQQNQDGNVQTLYSMFGIHNVSDFDGMVEGAVTSSNQVMIGSILVGNNAVTAGRQNIGNSTPVLGGQFFERPPSVSFLQPSLKAFIKMKNNVFQFAVIESCGNPVMATPTTQPPLPPPPPAPTPTPTPPPPAPQPSPSPTPQPHPNFTMIKEVSTDQVVWQKAVNTKPGQTIYFRITIKNTGDTTLTNVEFQDVVPNGLTFVADSLKLNTMSMTSGLLGVNLGSLVVGGQMIVMFQTTIDQAASACQTPLVNTASVTPEGVPKQTDTAQVFVCVPATPSVVTVVQTTPPPPPPATPPVAPAVVLPNTGMSDIAGLFTSFSIAGYLAYIFRHKYLIKLTSKFLS